MIENIVTTKCEYVSVRRRKIEAPILTVYSSIVCCIGPTPKLIRIQKMNNKHIAMTRSTLRRPAAKFVIPNRCVGAGPETRKLPRGAVPSSAGSTATTAASGDNDDFGFHKTSSYSNPLVLAVYRLADAESDHLDKIGDKKYNGPCNPFGRRNKRGRPSKKNDDEVIAPFYHSPKCEEDVYEAPWPAEFYSSYPFDRAVANNNPQCPFDYAGANYISAYPYVYAASMTSTPTSLQ